MHCSAVVLQRGIIFIFSFLELSAKECLSFIKQYKQWHKIESGGQGRKKRWKIRLNTNTAFQNSAQIITTRTAPTLNFAQGKPLCLKLSPKNLQPQHVFHFLSKCLLFCKKKRKRKLKEGKSFEENKQNPPPKQKQSTFEVNKKKAAWIHSQPLLFAKQ